MATARLALGAAFVALLATAGCNHASTAVPRPTTPAPGTTSPAAAATVQPIPPAAAGPPPVSVAPSPSPSLSPPPTRSPVPALAAGQPLAGRTVVLDPGHDGGNSAQPARLNALVPAGGFEKACNTAGTETNAGYPEHAFTFDVVMRATALLRAEGATVVLTRPNDTDFGPCVNQRAAIGNAAHADAVIAVHADGGPSTGIGFHVIAPALAPDGGNPAILAPSYQLALDVRSAFLAGTGEPYANYIAVQALIRRSDLAGLNLSRVPAVFIECGNMRNATDAARETDPVWRQRAAQSLTNALAAYLSR